MPQGPPDQPPESIVVGAFTGLKNTVSQERLQPTELERALNIDIDDSGQIRRRRGFDRKDTSSWHSVCGPLAGKTYGAKDGELGIIRADYSFSALGVTVGDAPVCYTVVDDDAYLSSRDAAKIIHADETVEEWGATAGQGLWLSPVQTPTDTLGAVAGALLGDPPKATSIEAYNGRIYLAAEKTLWATELFRYRYVDRTRAFMQFETAITLVRAVQDGLYVGTEGGLYFLGGARLGEFKLSQKTSAAVLPGSDVMVPTQLVHPQAANGPVPTGLALVCMTNDGVIAGFDSGSCYNLTHGRVEFPGGVSAAGLFREDQGVSSYVAAVDSAGGPSANARIGDYVEAEIVRASQRG